MLEQHMKITKRNEICNQNYEIIVFAISFRLVLFNSSSTFLNSKSIATFQKTIDRIKFNPSLTLSTNLANYE